MDIKCRLATPNAAGQAPKVTLRPSDLAPRGQNQPRKAPSVAIRPVKNLKCDCPARSAGKGCARRSSRLILASPHGINPIEARAKSNHAQSTALPFLIPCGLPFIRHKSAMSVHGEKIMALYSKSKPCPKCGKTSGPMMRCDTCGTLGCRSCVGHNSGICKFCREGTARKI